MFALNVALVLIVGGIALFIGRAIRETRGQIDRRLRDTDPRERNATMRDLAAQVREQADRIVCTRCDGPTFMLLGTDARYKCEECHFIFDGPPHLPDGA